MNHQTYLFNGLKWNFIQSKNVTWIFDMSEWHIRKSNVLLFTFYFFFLFGFSFTFAWFQCPFFSVLLIWCGCTIICVSFFSSVRCCWFFCCCRTFTTFGVRKGYQLVWLPKLPYFLCFSTLSVVFSSAIYGTRVFLFRFVLFRFHFAIQSSHIWIRLWVRAFILFLVFDAFLYYI